MHIVCTVHTSVLYCTVLCLEQGIACSELKPVPVQERLLGRPRIGITAWINGGERSCCPIVEASAATDARVPRADFAFVAPLARVAAHALAFLRTAVARVGGSVHVFEGGCC